ncbi:MAG: lipoyl(octanoyl) transferase LipB [Saprospiraceae bacterium]|nr:lipoyl(octanoyl) transferase LipB [Saprospiraceae bacterium]
MKQRVKVGDLGRVSYQKAWDLQHRLLDSLIREKRQQREKSKIDRVPPIHYFLFCEHDPVFTLGKSGKEAHLLERKHPRTKDEAEFFKINRGGDITFHGPGQLVGYPIFDLDWFFTDVHKYVRLLEEGLIRTLGEYAIDSFRIKDYTGVWIPASGGKPLRKICAIGVHLSRWITMHGFAFNINTELTYFDQIVPCGIADPDKAVTSLAKELGREIELSEVQAFVLKHFADLFSFQWEYTMELEP